MKQLNQNTELILACLTKMDKTLTRLTNLVDKEVKRQAKQEPNLSILTDLLTDCLSEDKVNHLESIVVNE